MGLDEILKRELVLHCILYGFHLIPARHHIRAIVNNEENAAFPSGGCRCGYG